MILDGHLPALLSIAAQALQRGDLVALPTETVYGLGADADQAEAVAKIFAAKSRPADHPLIVHVADPATVNHYAASLPPFASALMQAFWPGPLTLIVPRKDGVAAAAAGGQSSIGLRCPAHPVAQALLRAALVLGVQGVAAPSANQFGRVSPTTAAHVQGEFGADLLILDGGACDVGIESTIIDCTRGVPVLLRPGAITREQAQAVCAQPVLLPHEANNAPAPRASGTLASHYAPAAQLRLMDAAQLKAAVAMLGKSAASPTNKTIAVYARTPLSGESAVLRVRQMPVHAAAVAQELFAVLRDFDAQGVSLIWVETPPAGSDWDGVRDRLERAAA